MELILASVSPRRKELLSQLADFCVVPSQFEEGEGGSAREIVQSNARGKALDVLSRYPEALVLGADTVVALDGKIFGKPRDEAHAAEMLKKLSGRTHSVYTGVCLAKKGSIRECVTESFVTFRTLSEADISDYLKNCSPLDKAGAYGIQDGAVVRSYEGSYTNIVGLPLETVKALLKEEGYYD